MHSITSKDIVIFRHHQQLITENMILFLSIANKKKTFTTGQTSNSTIYRYAHEKIFHPKASNFYSITGRGILVNMPNI